MPGLIGGGFGNSEVLFTVPNNKTVPGFTPPIVEELGKTSPPLDASALILLTGWLFSFVNTTVFVLTCNVFAQILLNLLPCEPISQLLLFGNIFPEIIMLQLLLSTSCI